ncbi:MAG: RpiB/LacA/LacB family sugar-phosphate isomerase [Prevotellaceae bacterium]|jgi:ribose 5-phosphate isomerase B|nr:RpiB/LacA/LacB family sugar-phosphate isomerase [Prevotellaceae bacterium]
MEILGIASDHAGFPLKERLRAALTAEGYDVRDFGAFAADVPVDYPDHAHPLAAAVEAGALPRAIALCGTGNGMAITLNRHRGVRAGLCWLPEIATLIRRHNNANVCVIPARFIDEATAAEVVAAFLNTPFDGGRHQRRIDKIAQPEL